MAREMELMQGNQAIAEGAFYAGARFYAGYPITPSSEIAEECSKKMPLLGGIYMQMEDEIASMAAIIGAGGHHAASLGTARGPDCDRPVPGDGERVFFADRGRL